MAKLMAYHMNRGGLEVSVYLSEGVRNSGDLMGLWAQSIPFRQSLEAVFNGGRGDASPDFDEFNRQRRTRISAHALTPDGENLAAVSARPRQS